MAKKRKTREQKKLADLRHSFTHSLVEKPATFEAKIQLQPKDIVSSVQKSQPTKIVNAYPYLMKDLSKTATLTLSIIAVQIILFFLLTHHILKIPGLSY